MAKATRWGATPHRGCRAIVPAFLAILLAASCRKPEPAVSLVDLLPEADSLVDTREIDFGDPAARRHLVAGWGIGSATERTPYAWGLGDASTVDFEIAWARPLELVLEGEAFVFPGAPAEQVVEVRLNGDRVGSIAMPFVGLPARGFGGGGVQEHRLALPPAAQRLGANRLELRYAYSRSPAAVAAGARDDRPLAVAWHRLRLSGTVETPPPQARGDALLLPPFTGVSYFFRLPEGGRLTIDSGGPWRDWGGGADGEAALTVGVAVADAAAPAPSTVKASALEHFSLELPASAAAPVRLTLWAASAAGGAGLRLIRPRLERYGETAEAARRLPAASSAVPGNRANVVVYMVDTLRADHLGCYGYPRPTSPEIDRFAGEATLFTAARAQSSWTRPAVASIFTGLYPQVHGTNQRQSALPAEVAPMAELLTGAGYRTAAVITNGNVGSEFGFARGFASFVWLQERADRVAVHESADAVNERAFAWLQENAGAGPFFLYLHASDPHGPYTPAAPYRQRFAPDVTDPELGSNASILEIGKSRVPVDPSRLAGLEDLYDGEIAFTDAAFGRLLARLRELDLYDSTVVVLVSDHGEEFLEHGRTGHGKSLFQEQLAVPLVIRFPDGRGRGRRIAATARQIDILPTLLAYLGEPVPEEVQGHSLLPLLDRAEVDPLAVPWYAYLDVDGREIESVSVAERKLIDYLTDDGPRGKFELFDLARDPHERSDLWLTASVWGGYLDSLLLYRRHSWRSLAAPQVEAGEELRRRLRAAGYLTQ
jgi:arylsulfatase A-like enzyme